METLLKVLLVEDNDGDVVMTQRAFRDGKPLCHISVANDGLEAMDFLLKRGAHSGEPTPQLILLDLNMPRMDGKEFLDAVKADTRLNAIPVVVLTSSQSPVDIRECYQRHASCYVVKPFDGKEFADTARRVVSFWSSLVQLPTERPPLQHLTADES